MTHCPDCDQKLVRSATIVDGAVLISCRPCDRFRVDGSDQWVAGGPGSRNALRAQAGIADAADEKK